MNCFKKKFLSLIKGLEPEGACDPILAPWREARTDARELSVYRVDLFIHLDKGLEVLPLNMKMIPS